MAFRTSNPVFNSELFKKATVGGYAETTSGVMTYGGTVNKTIILFLITLFTSIYSWKLAMVGRGAGLLWVGLIGGFITALITIFKIDWAHITAPLYAAFEGLALGGISFAFEAFYHGIVLQAVLLTFGVMFAMLVLYKFRVIRVTSGFVKWLLIATGGIAAYYLIGIILSLFHINITTQALGGFGLVLQLFIVGIASLNFLLDFHNVEVGVENGAPKQFEWYAAFGLMVTLIWLYLEMLRLLAILSNRQ